MMLADLPIACLELRSLLGMRWRMSLTVTAAAALALVIGGHPLLAGAMGSWGFFVGTLCGLLRARLWFRDARHAPQPTRLRLVPPHGIRSGAGAAPAVAVAVTAVMLLGLTGYNGSSTTLVQNVVLLCGLAAGVDFGCAVAIGGWESRTGYRVARPCAPRPRLRGRELAAVPAGRLTAVPRLPYLIPVLCVAGAMLAGSAAAAVTDPSVDLPPAPAVSYVDPSLTAVSAELSGAAAPVTCWSARDWQSYQRTYDEPVAGVQSMGRIYLSPDTCRWLTWMRTSHGWPVTHASRFSMAEAAGVLTHETGHVVLGSNETNAECFAYDNVGRTAGLLGYPPAEANELATIYRTESHPQLPPRYLERPC
jgi:hypothetical protein